MQIRLCTIAMLWIQALAAQDTAYLRSRWERILPLFEYKQELKNFKLIPGGEFMSGLRTGQDSITLGRPSKKSVRAFLLSKFEVRNRDYRKFVDYVRDSIVHGLLGHFVQEGDRPRINWDAAIDWKDPRIEPIYLPPEERLFGRPEIDVAKLVYKSSDGQEIAVMPDTLCWIRDFAYSYNDPITKRYFRHPAFDNYPVVGITQRQAAAYCDWKTQQWNNALLAMNETGDRFIVRLPTGSEWEFAARGNHPLDVRDTSQTRSYNHPLYERNTNYGYRYNFGPYHDASNRAVKTYVDDGFYYTAPCDTYAPDPNGLYNMPGNVAEWTSTPGSYRPVPDGNGENSELSALRKKYPNSPFARMNEDDINAFLQKKVIVKGGAWSTSDYYLQPGVNQYFSPDSSAHTYIGFRLAVDIVPSQ